jgi:hypothetical protein
MPRKSVKQIKSFEQRLAEEAIKFKEAANREVPGSFASELLLRRARQAETSITLHINGWLSSPELQPPNAVENLLAGSRGR